MADKPAKSVERVARKSGKTKDEVTRSCALAAGRDGRCFARPVAAARDPTETTSHPPAGQERNDVIGLVLGTLVTAAGAALTGVFGKKVSTDVAMVYVRRPGGRPPVAPGNPRPLTWPPPCAAAAIAATCGCAAATAAPAPSARSRQPPPGSTLRAGAREPHRQVSYMAHGSRHNPHAVWRLRRARPAPAWSCHRAPHPS